MTHPAALRHANRRGELVAGLQAESPKPLNG